MRGVRVLEKDIERAILDYLSYLPRCFAWKNHSVGIYDKKKKTYRKPKNKYAINGVSDIVGIYKGKPMYLEVKTPKNRNGATDDQKEFLINVEKMGAICGIVASIEDVKEILAKY